MLGVDHKGTIAYPSIIGLNVLVYDLLISKVYCNAAYTLQIHFNQ